MTRSKRLNYRALNIRSFIQYLFLETLHLQSSYIQFIISINNWRKSFTLPQKHSEFPLVNFWKGRKKMNIVNILGLFLNIIGSLLIAFSYGNLKGLMAIWNSKDCKLNYPVGMTRPRWFFIGVFLLILGFIMQFIVAIARILH